MHSETCKKRHYVKLKRHFPYKILEKLGHVPPVPPAPTSMFPGLKLYSKYAYTHIAFHL